MDEPDIISTFALVMILGFGFCYNATTLWRKFARERMTWAVLFWLGLYPAIGMGLMYCIGRMAVCRG